MDAKAVAEWASKHLVLAEAPLAPHQVLLLERMRSGRPWVLMTPRRPDRWSTELHRALWLAYLSASSEDQARQVYDNAKRLVDA